MLEQGGGMRVAGGGLEAGALMPSLVRSMAGADYPAPSPLSAYLPFTGKTRQGLCYNFI